jgi:hypothetical protein
MKLNHVYYFPEQDMIFHVDFVVDDIVAVIAWAFYDGNVRSSHQGKEFFDQCIDLGEL